MSKHTFTKGDVVLINLPADNIYFSGMHGCQAQLVRKLHYAEGARWVFRLMEGPFDDGRTYRSMEKNLVPWRTYPGPPKEGGLPSL